MTYLILISIALCMGCNDDIDIGDLNDGTDIGLEESVPDDVDDTTENSTESTSSEDSDDEPAAQEIRSEMPRDDSPDIGDADYATFIANTNGFGMDLFRALDDSQNTVFSPVSTAIALSMNYVGARNETAVQMATALRNDLDDESFHRASNRLIQTLDSRNKEKNKEDKSVRLSLVNEIWPENAYPLLDDFLDTLAVHYDSGVTPLNYTGNPEKSRHIINQWVADETHDRIETLIPDNVITNDTRLVLTNVLYFYANWTIPFDQENTEDEKFSTLAGDVVTVPMMREMRRFFYTKGNNYQMVKLDYHGERLFMVVVLPDEGEFATVRESLNQDWIEEAVSNLGREGAIRLKLPKFDFTWGTASLKEPLQSLGMIDAFDADAADLSGITGNRDLFISEVLHQAYIKVDEEGTEAAAATAMVDDNGGEPETVVEFTVDRPFFFMILDETGVVLFVGQVVDPSK